MSGEGPSSTLANLERDSGDLADVLSTSAAFSLVAWKPYGHHGTGPSRHVGQPPCGRFNVAQCGFDPLCPWPL